MALTACFVLGQPVAEGATLAPGQCFQRGHDVRARHALMRRPTARTRRLDGLAVGPVANGDGVPPRRFGLAVYDNGLAAHNPRRELAAARLCLFDILGEHGGFFDLIITTSANTCFNYKAKNAVKA